VKFDIGLFINNMVKRVINRLFLSFIYILEDIRNDGKISNDEYQKFRKKILDHGNDAIREINSELQNFDFIFKEKDN
jgi:hypothetical protein